ncbi:LacI family DNA-binding transcriptional regulator [Rubrivirga sp.]|uniref:LacI family DNA-binding transcriptional regulator n=1 Tax=Rubrivirga sp. TaxID=1885344 RepID=UPI003B517880
MAKRITISDVAEKAGVSTGTVSAVINQRPTVRDATRAHVLRTIEELGYLPSASARRLGSRRNGDDASPPGMGIVIKEIDNPFYAEVVKGASAELNARGFVPFVCTSEGDFQREGLAIDSLRGRDLSGVIVAPVLDADADLSHLFLLRRSGFPFVLLETVLGLPTNVVSVDNVAAAQQAARHLIGLGHERIAHFAGPAYTRHSLDRRLGVEKAFSQSPLRFSDDAVVASGSRFEDGYQAGLRTFRERADRPTAVACFNDLVALGLIKALVDLGLRVPEDVSVVGFDDVPVATQTTAPLTTVQVPKREMGRRAVQIILDQIEEPEADPVTVVLDAALAVRATTGPPAGR